MSYDVNNPVYLQVDLFLPNTKPLYSLEIEKRDYDILWALQERVPPEVLVEALGSQLLGICEVFERQKKQLLENDIQVETLVTKEELANFELSAQLGTLLVAMGAILAKVNRGDGSGVDFESRQVDEKGNLLDKRVVHDKNITEEDKEFLRSFKIDTEGLK